LVVGNGTDENNRSNALMLKQNGDLVIKGDLKFKQLSLSESLLSINALSRYSGQHEYILEAENWKLFTNNGNAYWYYDLGNPYNIENLDFFDFKFIYSDWIADSSFEE